MNNNNEEPQPGPSNLRPNRRFSNGNGSNVAPRRSARVRNMVNGNRFAPPSNPPLEQVSARLGNGNMQEQSVDELTAALARSHIGDDNGSASAAGASGVSNGNDLYSQDSNNNCGLGAASCALLKNFDQAYCEFCAVPLKPDEGVMLQDCLHIFCRECLQSTIEMQEEVCQIPCPISEERKCGGYLTDFEVKQLVSPSVYQEYLNRSLVVAKKKMKNIYYCKTAGCSGWCEFEEGRKTFSCPLCNKSNCLVCMIIHSGVDCATYQELAKTGQLSKIDEIKEKESKTGWEQLTERMKSTVAQSGMSSLEVLDNGTGLLKNTMEFECPICFADVAIGEGIILHECLHLFCRTCLVNLVEHNEEVTVKCPYIDGNYSCVCLMQPREIKALLPTDIHEKHLQRSIKLGESSIQNSFHCKTPDCEGWCVYEKEAVRFKCPVCNIINCIPCQAIHTGSCKDYKNQLKQSANDKLSEEAVENLIKEGKAMRCPNCRIPVEKTAGCDWIKCSSCRTEICWITRGPRWGPKGNGDISGGCRCRVNGKLCHPKCGNCH